MKERPASQPQLDGGPIGGMCRMHAVIVLDLVKCGNEVGPEPSRNNRIPGFNHPDQEVRSWEYLITCPPPGR